MDETTVLEKKIAEMQKYVPFLEDVIYKLKNNRLEQAENPRKAQLQKMEMLYDLLTTKAQQLKLETLEKCEVVLSRLYSKIEKSDSGSSNNNSEQPTSDTVIDITCPASPPPQISKKVQPPIVIPTERLTSPITVVNVSNDKANNIKSDYQNKDITQRLKNFKDKITTMELENQKTLKQVNLYAQKKMPPVASNNSNKNDIYSPEECWNDNDLVKKSKTSLPPVERHKGVFDRLGDKVYPTLKITLNVNNPQSKTSLSSKASTQNPAPTNNTAKSLDLSNYMNEVKSSGCNDISEIGSRRPKNESAPLDKLQEAKKKLLTIYNNGTKQDNGTMKSSNSSIESMYSKSKSHLPLEHNNKPSQSTHNSVSCEKLVDTSIKTVRVDPRLSRSTGLLTNNNSTIHSTQHSQTQFSSQNRYGMNTSYMSPNDPRMNRTTNQHANDTNHSYYNRTWQDTHMQSNFIMNQMQSEFSIYSQNSNMYQDQSVSSSICAPQISPTSNQRTQIDAEENWDSDPETIDTHSRPDNSITTNVPNFLGRNMDKNFDSSLNNNRAAHHSNKNTTNVKPQIQTNKVNNLQQYQASKVVTHTFVPNTYSNKQSFNNSYNPRFPVNPNRSGPARFSVPQQQPRTYGEYKKAQEAARLAAVAKISPHSSHTPSQNQAKTQNETTKNPMSSPTSAGSPNISSPSTLDKLYRSTNFSNTSLPATRINFKIPKKDTTNKTDVDEDNNKNSNDNSISKSADKKNYDNSKSTENKNGNEKALSKSTDSSEHSKSSNDKIPSNNITKNIEESKKESKSIENATTIKNVTNNDKKSSSINKTNNEKVELTSNNLNSTENIADNTKNLSGHINESSNANNTVELKNMSENTIAKEFAKKRITQRRVTMCSMRTTPILMESELLPTTSLVMEDLQDKHNVKLDDKIFIKKSKRESDMYKITDDNCTVSIQNIIYGKRTTRTHVNFSEVQQAKTTLKQNDSTETPKNKKTNTKKGLTNTDSTSKISKKKQSKSIGSQQKSIANKKAPEKDCNTNESAVTEEATNSNSAIIQTDTDLESRVNAAVTDMYKYFPQCSGEELKNLFRSFLEKERNAQKQAEDVTSNEEITDKNLADLHNDNEEETKKQIESNTLKAKKRKKNELDRLNEDLNEMFIRDGVLTATGKRMCTHVATESAKKDVKISSQKTRTLEKQLSTNKTVNQQGSTSDLDVRESSPLNTEEKQKLVFKPAEHKLHKKCLVHIHRIKMPINKPCPKSKKREWLLDHVKNTWSKKKIKKEMKNTNIYWHSQSNFTMWCFICEKNIKFAAVHYKEEHGEYFLSRLPPSILERLKNHKSNKPLFGVKDKRMWFHRCPFCMQYLRNVAKSWVDHFSTHTGEYSFKCNSCGKVANKRMQLTNKCRRSNCMGTPVAENVFLRATLPIKGHVCHICNFVQMNRANLDTHYIEQHNYETEDVQNLGYSVDLLKIDNVKYVTESQGLKIEQNIEATNSSGLMESDDEQYLLNDTMQKNKRVIKNIRALKNENTEQNVSNVSGDCTRIDDNDPVDESVITNDTVVQDQLLIWAAELEAAELEKEAAAAKGSQKTFGSITVNSDMNSTILENLSNISNSNAFLQTNDTNDANDIAANEFYNSFAESIKSFESENHINVNKSKESSIISITDRLSQRLKDFSQKSNINTHIFPLPNESFAEQQVVVSRAIVKLDMSGEPCCSDITTKPELTDAIEKQNVEDDEDWEDVEIIDPVPKRDKYKNKRIYQKCTLIRKVNGRPTFIPKSKAANINNSSLSTESSSTQIDFTNLADLLPSSPVDIAPQFLSAVSTEPLHDLNGITSILETNLLSSNIVTPIENGTDSKNNELRNLNLHESTSTDLVVDSVNEVTETNALNRIIIKRIQNIAFAPDKNGYRFYCRIKGCSFIFSSHSSGLKSHCLSEHGSVKWNGFCNTCKFNVNKTRQDNLTIFDELNHLMKVHLIAQQSVINLADSLTSTTVVPTMTPTQQMEQMTTEIQSSPNSKVSSTQQLISNIKLSNSTTNLATTDTNVIIEYSNNDTISYYNDAAEAIVYSPSTNEGNNTEECRPRINVRRLTGDNLSTRKLNETNNNAEIINEGGTLANLLSRPPIIIQNSTIPNTSLQQNCNDSLLNNMENDITPVPVESGPKAIVNDKINTSNHNTTPVQTHFLKITNVCSLNPNPEASTSGQNSLSLRKYIPNSESNTTTRVRDMGFDEPQLIAETLPVSQETTGDFVITQTISTEYSTEGVPSGNLGFNISIAPTKSAPLVSIPNLNIKNTQYEEFKCARTVCNFRTRFSSTMRDHLHFHALQNFTKNRDYMNCPYCKFEAQDIDGYIEHVQRLHMPPNQNSLTKEIRNILNSLNDSNRTSSPATINKDKKTYQQELEETVKQILEKTGVPDDKLYRCVVPNCQATLTENTFNKHTLFHTSTIGTQPNQKLKCPHCSTTYKGLTLMKSHIQNHATHKYFCYICMQTSLNLNKFQKHMPEQHFQKLASVEPMLLKSNGVKIFVGHTEELTSTAIKEFGNKLILELKRQKAKDKTIFRQDEIDLLPVDQIFRKEVFCAKCNYRTKVRSNMLRHLQFDRCVQTDDKPAADPVNPVPCLNTSERHFDRMTNLASSSLTTGASPSIAKNLAILLNPKYKYVFEQNIYTCGVHGCAYRAVSAELFSTHINILHSTASTYNCPFCKEEISKRALSVTRILEHLQFHGEKLYQCTECDYTHFNKDLVEKHWPGKHPGVCTSIIEHERNENQTKTTKIPIGQQNKKMLSPGKPVNQNANNTPHKNDNEKQRTKFKWVCKICNFSCAMYQQMSSHTLLKHCCKHAYQCLYCGFNGPNKDVIEGHIKKMHVGSLVEHIKVFEKVKIQDEIANPKPLWQRDDPKRVRHIRGILMEDEEESTQNQRKLQLTSNIASRAPVLGPKPVANPKKKSSEQSPPAFAKIAQHLYLEKYTFACQYCDFISNFEGIKNHWQNAHSTFSGDFPKNHGRFLWTLVNYLKCPLCIDIYGTYNTLEQHFYISHPEHTKLIAADPHVSSLKCGFCAVTFTNTKTIQKHTLEQHPTNELREIVAKHFRLILKIGKNVNYFKCQECGDIFHERSQVVNHINEHHNEVFNQYNEHIINLGNANIYCCPYCKYYSLQEEETLKHMIDHYPNFKKCFYCSMEQTSFVSYMQHCYSYHREQSRGVNDLYTFQKIKNFLTEMLILFPNGLQLTKKSLLSCPIGCCAAIKNVHEYMLHVTMEPPIPRLSIASLVARKSIEVKHSRGVGNPSAPMVITLADLQKNKKISKRRNTVAIDGNFNKEYKTVVKKRKMSGVPSDVPIPTFQKIASKEPYSFYGSKPKSENLSNVYTVLNISNESTKVNVKDLQKKNNFNPNVVITKLTVDDIAKINSGTTNQEEIIELSDDDNDDNISISYTKVKKACPLSEKDKHE